MDVLEVSTGAQGYSLISDGMRAVHRVPRRTKSWIMSIIGIRVSSAALWLYI